MVINKKIKIAIAGTVIAALLLPTVYMTGRIILSDQSTSSKKQAELSSGDSQIAGDISNMTGAKTEDIILLKSQGRSWNEVLDVLKKNEGLTNTSRLQSDIGKDTIDRLKKDGYNDKDINEALRILEQVEVQLREIVSHVDSQSHLENIKPMPAKIENILEKEPSKEDYAPYGALLEKIDKKAALILMLKLSKKMETLEKALD